uniref:Retrovirus-related Pol polyprotein from transposon TNT 1-94-like beta-barrel domain-containing protein n=1 Tax=Tanacetum cinerariifolium TaxID=118510 RepID=A0A6L2KYY7_TANCI|nr:hypothetical protein [Tanacetum cinerariifolium]
MLLAKKDSDEQVLLAKDQAWMESGSDSDQEINANIVFMAQIRKVLSDSDRSSSSAKETIAEVSYYTSESESESEFETLKYYDNSTNYGLFVNNDDDQEIFQDAIEFASENFIENHIDSQKDYDKSEKRIEKANQQSKDLENQNKDLQEKYDILINQVNTFEEQNNKFNEQIKVLNKKNADWLAQIEVSQDQLKIKHVVIDTHTECQAQYAKLEEERYEYMIRYSTLFDNDKQHRKQIADQEVLFDKISVELVELDKHVRDLKNTVLENDFKIFELEEYLDTFSSVRRPKYGGVIWKKKGSSSTSNVDLSCVSVSKLNKNVKRYSRKDLLLCNNSHLEETSSAYVCNDTMNVSCNSRMCDLFDDNNIFIFNDKSVRISPVSKFLFRKKPRDSMNVRSKCNSNKSLSRTVHKENMLFHYKLALSQVEARLAEHRNQEVKYCEKIIVLKFKTKYRANCIESLTKELVLIKKEKEGLDSKLAGFQTASKDLDNFLERLLKFADDTITDYSMPSLAIETVRPTKNKTDKGETVKKPAVKYAKLYRKPSKGSKIYLWIIDSGCSKHVMGNRALLTNFVETFLRTVHFCNNDFVVIAGYGDVVIGSMTIKKVYYVEGLGHNLFSVGQFCDKGLEVAFRKSTCFVRNKDGVDLLTGDYLSYLLVKASSAQSWLWYQRLSHLNFSTINNLVKNNLVQVVLGGIAASAPPLANAIATVYVGIISHLNVVGITVAHIDVNTPQLELVLLVYFNEKYAKKPKRKNTQAPQHVADEVVYKERGDRLVSAATTASSLEAEQTVITLISPNPRQHLMKPVPQELLRVVVLGNILQSDEDRMKLNEMMELCTNLQSRVLDLEKTKTTQALEITGLKKRVKKLEKKQWLRTYKLKRLYKVGLIARVDSSKDEKSLGEDASKQVRISDINVDEDITLVNDQDDAKMLDVNYLHGEEVFVNKDDADKEVSDVGEVNVASIATTVSVVATITSKEITLAQALVEIKTTKPKANGIILQEPSKSTTTTTKIISSKKSQRKGKAIMIKELVKPKKKDQIKLNEEAALKLQAKLKAEFEEEQRLAREKSQKELEANIALIET